MNGLYGEFHFCRQGGFSPGMRNLYTLPSCFIGLIALDGRVREQMRTWSVTIEPHWRRLRTDLRLYSACVKQDGFTNKRLILGVKQTPKLFLLVFTCA